ncbi:cerberus [Pontoporia blainvillei]|uniref:Cerberus n=1 Tax=Pontoporia blainvillei TaxID=48723 RepID=A0ABX0S504_PONBL|nr:cerberus [Pontoporia blainvillei]
MRNDPGTLGAPPSPEDILVPRKPGQVELRVQIMPSLLLLLPLGKAARHGGGHQSQNSVSLLLLERHRRELSLGNHEEAEEKPDLFVAVPHLIGASTAGEGQRQREKMLSRFGRSWKKPERELHPPQGSVSEQFFPGTQGLTQPKDGMPMEKPPLREEAKKFWHRFMFRMSPASQGIILPIKSHEVHREACRTVPFSQTITHEDCEKVVVQNNLCFGKCGSVRFPEAAQHYTFCSHCLPDKFTTMHLQLNCTGLAPVVKLVMLVEECQCKDIQIIYNCPGLLIHVRSSMQLIGVFIQLTSI